MLTRLREAHGARLGFRTLRVAGVDVKPLRVSIANRRAFLGRWFMGFGRESIGAVIAFVLARASQGGGTPFETGAARSASARRGGVVLVA